MTTQQPTQPTAEGVLSRASAHGVAETLNRLEAAIQAKGLTIFARVDHSDEAARVGLTMQPAHVLIFGAPKAGTPLMIASPLLALDLPLRVLVWQDVSGQVWVSYTDPAYQTRRFAIPADLEPAIAGVAGLVDGALAEG